MQPEIVLELLEMFFNQEACSQNTLQEFLRSPAMKRHLQEHNKDLLRLGIDIRTEADRKAEAQQRKRLVAFHLRALAARYNREKLYEELWREPAQKVAESYGVSDVMLGKICRKLKIPKPGRGYWAKKSAGRRLPKRPQLPALKLV
jgi:hypothetical protein